MIEITNIEEAVAVLNDAKWRGQYNWQATPNGVGATDYRVSDYDILDALAIANAIKLKGEVEVYKQRAERCVWCGNYTLTIDVYTAEDGLEERCQNTKCPSYGEDVSCFARRLQQRLAALREAVEPFVAVARKIPEAIAEDDDLWRTFGWVLPDLDKWRILAQASGETR
jgi:hypothetical protein